MPISIAKHLLPQSLIPIFARYMLRIEPSLPDQLSETVTAITEHINENRRLFLPDHVRAEEIGFLIRTSQWARTDDKFVAILFNNRSAEPFAIVKVGPQSSRGIIEREFHNSMAVYNKLNSKTSVAIPEPVTIWDSGQLIAYFERVICGIPFSDYLKLILRKAERQRIFTVVIRKCTGFLLNLSSADNYLTAEDFKLYFHDPIAGFKCKRDEDQINLSTLKEHIAKIEINSLSSVLMHGDFWTGSVIYSKGEIGIIDWEMYTSSGVPLWDLFSLIFHIGTDYGYFTDDDISKELDSCIISLADRSGVKKDLVPILFQCFLLFNVQYRDTGSENYWNSLLQYYWSRAKSGTAMNGRLL